MPKVFDAAAVRCPRILPKAPFVLPRQAASTEFVPTGIALTWVSGGRLRQMQLSEIQVGVVGRWSRP
jgi:hypothetical protein